MDAFAEIRRRLANLERKASTAVRIGTVDKVDRTKCRARVLFPVPRKEGEEESFVSSEELPVMVKQSVGNRDYWLPTVGDQVVCVYDRLGFGFVIGSFYSDEEEIPEGAEAEGVRVTEFEDGTRVEYSTEESKLRVLVGDVELVVTPDGVRIGEGSADQPFVRGTDHKTLLSSILDLLAAHTHPTGVGPSGPPATAADFTAKKADIDGTLSTLIEGE